MLPYATIQEAEAAIGRSLTTAETLWFNYSATKSDYILFCHNIIFLFLIFSLFPFYYLFLEYFFNSSVGPYKIQPKVKLSFSDTLRCYKSVMRMFFLVVGPLQLVSYPSVQVFWLIKSVTCFQIVRSLFRYGKNGIFCQSMRGGFCNCITGKASFCSYSSWD